MKWDIFICHAWEDKAEVARPLAEKLMRCGLEVWLDEHSLTIGDPLPEKIDEGLAQSRYGAVILSPNFFARRWPRRELDGMVVREVAEGKVILPIWYGVTEAQVISYSPTLASKLAVVMQREDVFTSEGLDKAVREILKAININPPPTYRSSATVQLRVELTALLTIDNALAEGVRVAGRNNISIVDAAAAQFDKWKERVASLGVKGLYDISTNVNLNGYYDEVRYDIGRCRTLLERHLVTLQN